MTPPARQRTVTHLIGAAPADVYAAVTDVVATARHSEELVDIAWTRRQHPDRITIGDQFTSHNSVAGMSWTATSTVTSAEPGRNFVFAVSGAENPTATWTFELTAAASAGPTAVAYTVELGDGPSMFNVVTGGDPSRRSGAETQRLDALARNMAGLLEELDEELATPGAGVLHPPTNQ